MGTGYMYPSFLNVEHGEILLPHTYIYIFIVAVYAYKKRRNDNRGSDL